MIKILYISHSSGLAGAETALLTLLRRLDRKIFQPLVILPRGGYLEAEIEKLDIPLLFLEIPWWLRGRGPVPPSSLLGSSWSGEVTELEPLALMRLAETGLQERLSRLQAIIQDNGIQIVHSNTFPIIEGALAARLTGVKHVWHLHEMDGEEHPALLPYLPAATRNWLLSELSEAVVVVSQYLAGFFAPHVAPERLRLIHNGVETEFGHLGLEDPKRKELRQQCRRELGLEPHHQVICSVGHAGPEKGWPDLVATAGLLASTRADLRLVVVGETQSDGFPLVQAQVRRLGLADKIIFTGPRADAQRIMLAGDVVFQPSLMESLSLVALEGMALSLPVVATRCGGTEEAVQHRETGFLAPIGDIPHMAAALAILLDNPEMRRRCGEAGRQVYLEKFTAARYADRFMELYRGLLQTDELADSGNRETLAALASLYAALLGSVMQAEHTRQRLEHTRQQLQEIVSSRSYRLMEPLRRLRRFLG